MNARVKRSNIVIAISTTIILPLGMSACRNQETTSNLKSEESCSATNIDGQCILTKNGATERFSPTQSKPCFCEVNGGDSYHKLSGMRQPSSFDDSTKDNDFASDNIDKKSDVPTGLSSNTDWQKHYEQVTAQILKRQLATIEQSSMPEGVKEEIKRNLLAMQSRSQRVPEFNRIAWDKITPGYGNSFQTNCVASYVNGVCTITKNGKTETRTTGAFSGCMCL